MASIFLPFILLSVIQAIAHEEPAKTIREKKEKEKQRLEIVQQGIRSVTVYKYRITTDQPDTAGKSKFYATTYDPSGNISVMMVYKNNDSLDYRIAFTYDEYNNMMSDTDYDPDGTITEQISYQYDTNHRVLSQRNYKKDGIVDSWFTYQMIPDERLIRFTKWLPTDSMEYQIIYHYSGHPDSTNATEIVKQKPDGTLLLRVENEYDPKGVRQRKKIFSEKNILQYSFIYSYYSENGKFKTITKRSPDQLVFSTTTYSINTAGLTEYVETRDSNGKLIAYSGYEYDYKQ